MESKFSPCRELDGALSLSAFQSEEFLGEIQLEWISKSSGNWMVQAYDDFGQTHLKLAYAYAPNTIQLTKPDRLKFPKLSFNEDRFLELDGHMVPVHSDEFACLLSARWPKSWLSRLVNVEKRDAKYFMTYADDERKIYMSLYLNVDKTKTGDCASIVWRPYWFTSSKKLKVCMQHRSAGVLSGVQDMRISWKVEQE